MVQGPTGKSPPPQLTPEGAGSQGASDQGGQGNAAAAAEDAGDVSSTSS